MSKSPWKHLVNNPPAMCRLLARRRTRGKMVRALSLQEIAIVSGLPLARVQAISQSPSWDGITIPEAERFVAGCGFDPLSAADRNRQAAYDRSCKKHGRSFTYLHKEPERWETEFLPLIQSLAAHRKKRRAA